MDVDALRTILLLSCVTPVHEAGWYCLSVSVRDGLKGMLSDAGAKFDERGDAYFLDDMNVRQFMVVHAGKDDESNVYSETEVNIERCIHFLNGRR